MPLFKNSTPQAVHPGFRDDSILPQVSEAETVPQHLPIVPTFAARGKVNSTQYLAGAALTKFLGDETFNPRGQFYGPSIALIESVLGAGNSSVAVCRLPAPGAARARLCLAIEMVEAEYDAYVRNADGSVVMDNGNPQTDAGTQIDGYLFRWVVVPVDANTAINGVAKSVGTLAGKAGVDSTIYPILALETEEGEDYNRCGIRLWAPVAGEAQPVEASLVNSNEAMIYRVQMVERKKRGGGATVINSLRNERSVDIAFAEGVYDESTNVDYAVSDILDAFHNDDDTSGVQPRFGPFSGMHFYRNFYEEVIGLVAPKEETASGKTVAPHMLNILSGKSVAGNHHYALRKGTGGVSMNSSKIHYATGGADGDTSFEKLSEAVIDFMDSGWDTAENFMTDLRRHPFSDIYDVGFPVATKLKMPLALSYRPNVRVNLTTEVHGETHTFAEADSIAAQLNAALALHPESALNGTGVCRGVIETGQGVRPLSKYKGMLPTLFDLAEKRAAMGGGEDGKLKPALNYTIPPLNTLNNFAKVTGTLAKHEQREIQWNSNQNYVIFKDRKTLLRPAVQTVNKSEVSVLNSDIVVGSMCNLVLVCESIWTEVTGRSDLTPEELIQELEEQFNQKTAGKYPGVVRLVPRAYLTPADRARGTSFNLDVEVYASGMISVGVFNIIAKREA